MYSTSVKKSTLYNSLVSKQSNKDMLMMKLTIIIQLSFWKILLTQAVYIHCKTFFYNKMFDDTDVVKAQNI